MLCFFVDMEITVWSMKDFDHERLSVSRGLFSMGVAFGIQWFYKTHPSHIAKNSLSYRVKFVVPCSPELVACTFNSLIFHRYGISESLFYTQKGLKNIKMFWLQLIGMHTKCYYVFSDNNIAITRQRAPHMLVYRR